MQRCVLGAQDERQHEDDEQHGGHVDAGVKPDDDERHERDAEHDAHGLGEPDPSGDEPALANRHLVGDGRGEAGVRGIDGGLTDAPDHGETEDGRLERERAQGERSEHRAPEHPGPTSSEPSESAIREGTCGRVGDDRHEGPDAGDPGERCLLATVTGHLLCQPREQVLDRGVERQHDAEVREHDRQHVAPADRRGRLCERRRRLFLHAHDRPPRNERNQANDVLGTRRCVA